MKLFKQIYKYIIFGIFLIVIGCLLVNKINIISLFNIKNIRNYDSYVDGLVELDTYKLSETKVDNYLIFDNLKIGSDLINKNSIKFYKGDMYLDLYKGEVVVFKSVDPIYKDTDRNKFFKAKNIETDIDLFKYLLKTKDKKFNIFSSNEEIKNNYAIHFLVSNIYKDVNSISFLEGDYEGYILNYSNYKEINIIKNKTRYSLILTDEKYFNEKNLKKLLNTIVIK